MSDPLNPGTPAAAGDPFAELEASRARMHGQLEAARARNAALHVLAEQTRTAEATARSPRGEVEVTAEAGGAIRAVRFAEHAAELAPADLGRLTTETIVQAQRAAAAAAVAAVEVALGPSPIVDDLRREVAERFGTPPGPQ